MSKKFDIEPGDWVRFYKGGTFVIGVVCYVKKDGVLGDKMLLTDCGIVAEDEVIDARSGGDEVSRAT